MQLFFIGFCRFCIRFPFLVCIINFGVKGFFFSFKAWITTLDREILHMAVVTDDGEALSEAFSSRGEENNLSSKTK